MPDLILLDSNVIIDVIQEKDDVYAPLKRLFESAEAKETMIVISSASRAEVKYLRELSAQGMSQQDQNALISGWFDSDYIYERAADRAVCDRAAELRRYVYTIRPDKALTPIDSIILATAELMKVSQVLTLDDGKSGERTIGGKPPIGLLELDGQLGDNFPAISLPVDYKGQMEIDLDENEEE